MRRLSDELYRRLDELKQKIYITIQGQKRSFSVKMSGISLSPLRKSDS